VGSSVLTVLSFTLLLPIFGSFPKKGAWSLVCFLIAIGFFIKAHQSSGYESGKAKPNSLLYVLDADKNKANWTTYDTNLDEWTKTYLGENPKDAAPLNIIKLYSKYGSEYTFMADAEVKNIPKPTIAFLRDTVKGNQRLLKILITPNRKVNRYDVFTKGQMTIHNLKANGARPLDLHSSIIAKNKGSKILTYYVVDNAPLELEFSIPKNQKPEMILEESSFDLMTNPVFSMAKRKNWMMPTPFVLNDAVVIKQTIKPSAVVTVPVLAQPKYSASNPTITDTIQAANGAN
jgi:hypothetical protein